MSSTITIYAVSIDRLKRLIGSHEQSAIGERLENFCGIVGASEWMEEVDAILKNRGISLRLRDLVYAGSPVSIPEPDDYPFIGFWTADAIAGAAAEFPAGDLASLDPEMRETLTTIQTWIDAAAKKPDASLVGFLS